jgi:hypothetical protein
MKSALWSLLSAFGLAALLGCTSAPTNVELGPPTNASSALVFPAPAVRYQDQPLEQLPMGPAGLFVGPSRFNQRPIGRAFDGRYQGGEVIYYRERYYDRQGEFSPNRFYRHMEFHREGVLYR